MKTFTRREYNLVVKCLDYYETFMNQDEKNLSQIVQDKLYYFNVDKQVDDKNDCEFDNVSSIYDDIISYDKVSQTTENCGV